MKNNINNQKKNKINKIKINNNTKTKKWVLSWKKRIHFTIH